MKQNRKNAFYLVLGVALIASFSFFYSRSNKSTFRSFEPDDSREPTTENIDSAVEEVTEEPVDLSSRIVDAFFESDDDYSGSSSVEEHDHILREWRGSLNPSPEDWRERLKSLKPGDKFKMSLPSIGQTELTITKAGAIGAGRAVVRASYGSENMSSTVIAFVGDAISMAISDPGNRREYSLRNGSDGFQYVSEIDLEVAMVCQTCVENLNPSARP
jgi:hypothetical protein